MSTYQNVAAYQFARLEDLPNLRQRLLKQCLDWHLKGTILLSPEGINLFVSGIPSNISSLMTLIRSIPGLETFQGKYSDSDHQPFRRMLIRLKKEIIAFGVEGIDPANKTSPKLPPKQLKQWLDEKRPLILLDTRNDYEVELGTFHNALPIGVKHFRDFPKAVRGLNPELKDQPIVMFCTGGIRCEKAGPFMEREGFKEVYQLEGGILKYFEECGSEHYQGECFVFDQRVGVNPDLHETETKQCYRCLHPLTVEDQKDSRYQPGHSCPYCFKSAEEQMGEVLTKRHEALKKGCSPLPGSIPYNNYRPISVPQQCHEFRLSDMLQIVVRGVSREEWLQEMQRGHVVDSTFRPVTGDHQVKAGERYYRMIPNVTEPDVNSNIHIIHEDAAMIVVNKPAPLPIHPSGRFNKNTLSSLLSYAYPNEKLRPAHRLDASTTGLVLLTRTRRHASRLQPQFESGQVEKLYLTRIHGHPQQDFFECDLPIREESAAGGARDIDTANGLAAKTLFKVIKRLDDGSSVVEARPLTGRTNQIRVHLWHLGHPIVGDGIYLPNRMIGDTQTLDISAPPLCLHSFKISFNHPYSDKTVTFTAPPPEWTEGHE